MTKHVYIAILYFAVQGVLAGSYFAQSVEKAETRGVIKTLLKLNPRALSEVNI